MNALLGPALFKELTPMTLKKKKGSNVYEHQERCIICGQSAGHTRTIGGTTWPACHQHKN